MKSFIKAITGLICIIFLMAAVSIGVHMGCEYYCNHFNDGIVSEVATFDDIDSTDSISIEDHLQFRWELKEALRTDSIYLHMPDEALLSILTSYGSDLSNAEIAYIYESNIDTYRKINLGTNITNTLDSLKYKTFEDWKTEILHKDSTYNQLE